MAQPHHPWSALSPNVNSVSPPSWAGSSRGSVPGCRPAFLGVWLAPLGQWLHGIPGCVFHCYSCPLSSFACPVGIAANYAALLPVALEVPYLLIGMLLLVGALAVRSSAAGLVRSASCRICSAELTTRKITLPGWVGHIRYVVLVGPGPAAAPGSRLQRHPLRGTGRLHLPACARRARWKPDCLIPSRACSPAMAGS